MDTIKVTATRGSGVKVPALMRVSLRFTEPDAGSSPASRTK